MKNDMNKELMRKAVEKARETMNKDIGGPFGALIIDESGKVLAVASNSVLKDHDPTAHAEINAIRQAAKAKGTYDLRGCTIYSTSYPCPMCLGAIIWANIKTLVYGCDKQDAAAIGFRDDFIYEYISGGMKDAGILDVDQAFREECLALFQEYEKKEKQLY